MRAFICVVAAVTVALAMAGNALADASEGQSYFTVMGSYVDDDKDRNVDDGINGGQFGFGRAMNERWNFELFYMAGRGQGNPDIKMGGIGFDLQYVMMRDERFSPYFFGGAGWLNVDPVGEPDEEGAMLSAGLGFYRDLKHFAESADIPAEQEDEAAKALFAEYLAPMTNQNLTEEEATLLLTFLLDNDNKLGE